MDLGQSPLHERMIFNVGAQRSGTFWLQRIVTAHSAISAIPSESALFSDGIAPLFERFQQAASDSPQLGALYVERDKLLAATRRFCDAVLADYLEPGARFLSERTPMHVSHLELIAELYPDARVIHIIRDGRDVARSVVAQPWGPETVGEAAAEWAACIEAARAAGLPADRYREVHYEALMQDPEPEVAGIFEWLGLSPDPAELEEAIAEANRQRNVDRFGKGGVAKAKWQESFGPGELAQFDAAAGELLSGLGYPPAEGVPESAPATPPRRDRPLGALPSAARAIRRAPEPEPVRPGQLIATADRAVESLRPGSEGRLLELIDAEFRLTVVSDDGEEAARGPQAADRLGELIRSDEALAGRQVLARVHTGGGSTFGYVLGFEVDGGRRLHRVVFVTVRPGKVAELTFYAIP
jgi:hypothetical protein